MTKNDGWRSHDSAGSDRQQSSQKVGTPRNDMVYYSDQRFIIV